MRAACQRLSLEAMLVTTQPCHGEPFFGEAISPLSGEMDRQGIASSQRTLLAMASTTVLRQGEIVTKAQVAVKIHETLLSWRRPYHVRYHNRSCSSCRLATPL